MLKAGFDITDYRNDYKDNHSHLSLNKSEKEAYLKNKEIDKTNMPTFDEKKKED